jgi:hypothetical protein
MDFGDLQAEVRALKARVRSLEEELEAIMNQREDAWNDAVPHLQPFWEAHARCQQLASQSIGGQTYLNACDARWSAGRRAHPYTQIVRRLDAWIDAIERDLAPLIRELRKLTPPNP